jgi:hypothetical protein
MSKTLLTTIQSIAGLFKNSFKVPIPLKSIPTEVILVGSSFREGLSAIDIASKIIERKKEIGINIEPLPSGAQNIDLQMEVIRIEEIINALLTKSKIEVAIPPGTLITATGGNAGGPIVVQGATISITKGVGIIR